MKKAGLVILVLAIGVAGAMLFRKSTRTEPVKDASSDEAPSIAAELSADGPRLGLRQGVPLPGKTPQEQPGGADAIGTVAPGERANAVEPDEAVVQTPPVQPPSFGRLPRPALPKLSNFNDPSPGSTSQYPARPSQFSKPPEPPRWTPRAEEPEKPEIRRHTIVNGDTLERIARRYLGTTSRADDILRWNQDVIKDRHVLPLGTAIKIPPRTTLPRRVPRAVDSPRNNSDRPSELVPVPDGVFSRGG